jgi:hypothetical protein
VVGCVMVVVPNVAPWRRAAIRMPAALR